jgi:hypothetical protein
MPLATVAGSPTTSETRQTRPTCPRSPDQDGAESEECSDDGHGPGCDRNPSLAHGLVHLLYLAPDVPEFTFDKSWLVPDAARRPLGLGLMVATVATFLLLSLAVWGVLGLSAAWPALTVLAALLSAVLLVAFWDIHLVFGLAIDVAIFAVAMTRPHWAQQLIGAAGG